MMTGRDLIIYILENHLEDRPVFENGAKFLGFMTVEEAAVNLNVGVATIRAWVDLKLVNSIKLGDTIYIPANAVPSKEIKL